MIIAIDGLAASGKSSTAKLLANKLGFVFFSTGKMYRALTAYVINNDLVHGLPNSIIECIQSIKILLKGKNFDTIVINDIDYSKKCFDTIVTQYVSTVSAIPEVRKKMVEIQRDVAKNNNIVCEGRDIGTVVFPKAEFKFFFKSSIKSRVNRRYYEIIKRGTLNISKKQINLLIRERDYKDIHRKESPLKKAKDAVVIITTNKTLLEQTEIVYNKIKMGIKYD